MIINRGHIESITNEKVISFELNNDEGHLYGVLSELYSNPVESTIREIATNCADAHILSRNEDRPFIIKLPNHEKNILNLCFRDFGPGLNHEEVMNVYRIYGVSTKSNTNKATGCLGLGSKSPFSITSTFFVKSYYNGVCSQYTCSMDNMGKPTISEVPQTFKTEEENGLEVIIPFYKEVDFKEILPRILKYFKVKPIVVIPQGELIDDEKVYPKWKEELNIPVRKLTEAIEIKADFMDINKAIYCLDNYHSINSGKIANEVIQLQIYYPLDTKLILDTIKRYNKLFTDGNNLTIPKFKISDETISYIDLLLKFGIRFSAAPGMIAFSPSRETIKYTDMTLYYIIQQLVKAANNYRRIIYSKYKHITTYDQAYDILFTSNDQFTKAINYFKIDKSKHLLALFEQVKSKQIEPINFLGFKNINNGESFQNYGDSIFNLNVLGNCSLIREKTNIAGSKFEYTNIFNVTEGKVSQFSKSCFMFHQIDPFFEAVIESVVRKNIGMLVDNIYNELDKVYKLLMTSDFVTRTEIGQNKTSRLLTDIFVVDRNIKDIYSATNLKDDYKEYTIFDIEKIIDNFNSMIHDAELTSVYNRLIKTNSNGENIAEEDEKYIIGTTTYGICYDLISALKIYFVFMSRISLVTNYTRMSDIKNYQKDFIEIKIKEASKSLELIKLEKNRYEYIRRNISITFNKIAVAKRKLSKRVFDNKLNGDFKFEDFIERFKWFLSNPKVNRFLPLKEFSLIKSKDMVDSSAFISSVIIHTYCKFFPNEFENTIDYISDIPARRLEAIEELASFGIPKTYLINLKPISIYKEYRASPEKRALQEKKSMCGLFYYDFEITEDLINELKYLLFKSVVSLKKYISKNIELMYHNENHLSERNIIFKSDLTKQYAKIFNLEDYPMLFNSLNKRIKNALNFINTISVDFTELSFKNYNKIISYIYRCTDHAATIKKMNNYTTRDEFGLEEPNFDYITPHTNVHKNDIFVSILINNKRYLNKPSICKSDQFGKEFLWFREGFYEASESEVKELHEKLFKNKIVFMDTNLKIKEFNNAFPDEFDLDLIRSSMGDSKIRSAKKKFFDNNIFSNYNNSKFEIVRKAVDDYFPDYLFLDFNETLSSKLYGSDVYNFYPFLFKWWRDSGVKSLISYDYQYNGHNLLRYSKEDIMFPNMRSAFYIKLCSNHLLNLDENSKTKSQKRKTDILKSVKHHNVRSFIWAYSSIPEKLKLVKIIQRYLTIFGNKKLGRIYYGISKDVINKEDKLVKLVLSLMPQQFTKEQNLINNDWTQSYQTYNDKFTVVLSNLQGVNSFMAEVKNYFPDIDRNALQLDCSQSMVKVIKNHSKMIKLLKDFGEEFKKIMELKAIDTDNIKSIFEEYFAITNKESIITRYKNPTDFLNRYINKTTDETIHTKINSRIQKKKFKK